MYKLLIQVPLLLISFSIFPVEKSELRISGVWVYTDKGDDFIDEKTCEFLSSGDLRCTISEFGFSDRYGDGHVYKTIGSWSLKGKSLTLVESPTYSPETTYRNHYKIIELTNTKLVLLKHGGAKEKWYQTKAQLTKE